MRYTYFKLFPYPTDVMPANGATHLEFLAKAVDAELDILDVEWPARVVKPVFLKRKSTNDGSYIANTPKQVLVDDVTPTTAGATWDNADNYSTPFPVSGWWHFRGMFSGVPSGGVTAASFRQLDFVIYDLSNPYLGSSYISRTFSSRTPEAGGDTNLAVEGMVYGNTSMRFGLRFNHGNVASTFNANNFYTRLSVSRVCPEV